MIELLHEFVYKATVMQQNLPDHKTGFGVCQVSQLLANPSIWTSTETAKYKTCIALNTSLIYGLLNTNRDCHKYVWDGLIIYWKQRSWFASTKGRFRDAGIALTQSKFREVGFVWTKSRFRAAGFV